MNTKLEQYCYHNKLEIYGNIGYGTYNGYEMNISYVALDNVTPIHIHISFYANIQNKKAIYQRIVQQRVKFLKVELDEFGVSAPAKDVIKKFNFTSDEIVRRVKEII